MNIPATLKHSFLLCLFAAAVPLRAIPAPMQVTAATPALRDALLAVLGA